MTFTEPRLLAERQAIIDTVNAISMEADRHEWQACRACFGSTVRVDYSSLTGEAAETLEADELIQRWKALLPTFEATQHLVGSHRVRVEGDYAHCRSQFIATHVARGTDDLWTLGGTYEHELERTDHGWLVNGLTCHALWQAGTPPA